MLPDRHPLTAPGAQRPRYTSRIQKAASALPEIKTLLSFWDLEQSVDSNVQRFERENILSKASRTRMSDLLRRTFKQRYLADPEVLPALVVFAHAGTSSQVLDPILYFLAAESDPLLRDAVLDYLAEALRDLRRHNFTEMIDQNFSLGANLNARDVKAVRKTVSGLIKIIHRMGADRERGHGGSCRAGAGGTAPREGTAQEDGLLRVPPHLLFVHRSADS